MKKRVISSPLTKRLLLEVGENIRLARLRRHLSIRTISLRAGLSINTILSIEKGIPGVSFGAVANTLHAIGLADDLSNLAKDDSLGRKLQDIGLLTRKRAPKRKQIGHEDEK